MNEFHRKIIPGASPARRLKPWCRGVFSGLAIAGACLLPPPAAIADDGDSRFRIEEATWDREKRRVEVKGKKERRATVTVVNAYAPGQTLGTDSDRDDEDWRVRSYSPNPVPCRVRAIQSDGRTAEQDVKYAPSSCMPKAPTQNQPPTADAGSGVSGTVGVAVTFDGSGSSDPDGTIVSYAWDFGDGSTGSGVKPSHVYSAAETYNVTLTVTDNQGAKGTDTITADITDGGGGPGPDISINSTSQDSAGVVSAAVPQQPQVVNGNYSVLAINDLGMHCGDLDTRIASILPPFQVLLAQVIRKGSEPDLNPTGVRVYYSAAANPNDPALGLGGQPCKDGDGNVVPCVGVYKTNFWDYPIPLGSYDPFYPAGLTPLATTTNAAVNQRPVEHDVGLPVPNVERLYIQADGTVVPNFPGTGDVWVAQQDMPGIANPYLDNEPQVVEEHLTNKPFFPAFPFGYIANDVNWHEGAGIPFAAYDDFGRENAYPLVRVQAKQGNTTLATVDTVLPISGEASCTNCHADPADVQDSRTSAPTQALLDANLPVAISMDDPDPNLPNRVSVEYAADINVLRLHDLKHGDRYVSTACDAPDQDCTVTAPSPCDITANGGDGDANCLTYQALVQVPPKPVVCQVCHYTPALDLAQLGPLAGEPGTLANGRNQLAHKSNSNVMHSHHGTLTDDDGNPLMDNSVPPKPLFPSIDPPDVEKNPESPMFGDITNQDKRLGQLEDSCYQCHPGKNTQCLRGAMFNGGMLCSDCHGGMEAVGADFSAGVSPSNPGDFQLGLGNFYDHTSNQPRVPWANEPGCGSCHTGDAMSNVLTNNNDGIGASSVIVNVADTYGNTDGIRLRQAFRVDDAKATPIVPVNTRFAENPIPQSFNGFDNPGFGTIPGSGGARNPKLYRVSTGHEGVMCEGCHGATHAEWPNGNPNANDNVTANQLQGHTGTIVECSTCHGAGWEPSSSDALGGPHGMHVVGDTDFSDGGHEHIAEDNGNACFACHGGDSRRNSPGTVLSRAAADRTLRNEGGTVTVAKGEPVGCVLCHGGSGD